MGFKYTTPVMTVVTDENFPLLCASPEAGGLEGIEYEDWVTKD